MLIENKFLFISLPRCASTSFYISCLRNDLDIKHGEQTYIDGYIDRIDLSLNNEDLADRLVHLHEGILNLKKYFGSDYEIIAIRRNRYERFISVWKHLIDMIHEGHGKKYSDILRALDVNDILFYDSSDIIDINSLHKMIDDFVKRIGLNEKYDEYIQNMFEITFRPLSYWHNHDPNIKWFEFGKFDELEEWVSNKIGKPFKMEKSNGSQHFDCNLKLNDEFITRYNSIYNIYDIVKSNKTLL
jgi:hypothetical protein